ncbi:MAG: chemotaxis protein CheD [Elusimicrobia bacterium RIFOXYB2_FULL_49_7]|nr:MAG: chemotaxis protein CheD [Elusimicrobia bacterium RIFOXYB2_FULL_49_7]
MAAPLVVDIADMKFSKAEQDVLITYALGSCIGVSAYDPELKVGALLHFMLPESALDPRKAQERPYMFADTGVHEMFKHLAGMGSKSKRLIVKACGGSNLMDPNGTFNIGKRNYLALKKILWRFNIILKGEDIGGTASRNMSLRLDSGDVSVRYSGIKEERAL